MLGPRNEQNDSELYSDIALMQYSNFEALYTSHSQNLKEHKLLISDTNCQGQSCRCNLVNLLITCPKNEQKWLIRVFWSNDWVIEAHFIDQISIYFSVLQKRNKNQTAANQKSFDKLDKWPKNELNWLIFQSIEIFSIQKKQPNFNR